jgi:RimJ/RimL family protein N-acetyltransferase
MRTGPLWVGRNQCRLHIESQSVVTRYGCRRIRIFLHRRVCALTGRASRGIWPGCRCHPNARADMLARATTSNGGTACSGRDSIPTRSLSTVGLLSGDLWPSLNPLLCFQTQVPFHNGGNMAAYESSLCGRETLVTDRLCLRRATDEPVGLFHAFPGEHKTDFHFGISKSFWAQGLASDAGRVALGALWRPPETQRIWTVCDVENVGSKRVLEELGLSFEGTLKRWVVLPAFCTKARDCHVFRATRVQI